MIAAADGPTDGAPDQRRLFEEIGRLKTRQQKLQRDLAECRRQNVDLRRQLAHLEGRDE
jgi:hypothetical protein